MALVGLAVRTKYPTAAWAATATEPAEAGVEVLVSHPDTGGLYALHEENSSAFAAWKIMHISRLFLTTIVVTSATSHPSFKIPSRRQHRSLRPWFPTSPFWIPPSQVPSTISSQSQSTGRSWLDRPLCSSRRA